MSAEVSRDILSKAWKVPLDEEMKRFPELRQKDIDTILAWCEEQPHLPPVSKHTAALFLIFASYKVEKAEFFIENHYTYRTYFRRIFSDRDPLNEDINIARSLMHVVILDGHCKAGCRVMMTSLKSKDSSKYNPWELAKLCYMMLEKDTLEKGFSKEGYNLLVDASGTGLGHMMAVTPSYLKQVFSYFLDGANMSIVEINIINVNVFVEKLFSLTKSLSPPIVYERIKLYSKDKNHLALDKFPAEILPKDVGGMAPPLSDLAKQSEEDVKKFRPWYLAEEKYLRVDESKRPLNKQNKKVVKLQEILKAIEID